MSETANAYAAGLIDGEGCFYVDPNGLTPRLEVGMAEGGVEALRWLAERYGGKVRRFREESDKWQASYRWYLIGATATEATRLLRPYLRVKAAQADRILRLAELREQMPTTTGGRARWTPELRDEAEACRLAIRALNRPREFA